MPSLDISGCVLSHISSCDTISHKGLPCFLPVPCPVHLSPVLIPFHPSLPVSTSAMAVSYLSTYLPALSSHCTRTRTSDSSNTTPFTFLPSKFPSTIQRPSRTFWSSTTGIQIYSHLNFNFHCNKTPSDVSGRVLCGGPTVIEYVGLSPITNGTCTSISKMIGPLWRWAQIPGPRPCSQNCCGSVLLGGGLRR